jgi:hypothetical protein
MKLLLAIGLLVLTAISPASALTLSLPKNQLREQILKITPLGMSKAEAERLIKAKIKPVTFYPGIFSPGNMPEGEAWPLGGKNLAETFGCNLGKTNNWLVTYTQVDAAWGFDAKGKLVDVWVFKHATGL